MSRTTSSTRARAACLAACVALAVLPGCAFRRTVTNEHFRSLDTTAIRVGQSTWLDVLEALGPPTPPNSEAIGQEGATLRFFRYPSSDHRSVGFTFPAGVILPFRWTDEVVAFDTVIAFDANGVVEAIYQGGADGIWRPFEDEGDRERVSTGRVEGRNR